MADNTTLNTGTGGDVIATDDIGGVKHQRVKIEHGADGSATDVSTASPLPVTLQYTGANATAVKMDVSAVTQPVSAASLPLPTGAATAAKQPALGTAGTPSADVISVQGVVGGQAVPVSGTFYQATQPVSAAALPLPSGAATAALQGGGLPAALGAGGGLKVDGSGTALPVSAAALPLPSGAASESTLAAIAGYLDTEVAAAVALLGTMDADTGAVAGCVAGNELQVDVVSSALPTGAATGAKQDAQTTLLAGGLPAALGAGGGLKVDGSGTALPVSAAALPLPSGAATSALQGGGLPAALGAGGGLKVDGSGTALPISAASLPLPTGAAAESGGNLAAAATSLAIVDDWDSSDDCRQIRQSASVMDGATRCDVKRFHVVTNTDGADLIAAVANKKFRLRSFAIFAIASTLCNFWLEDADGADVLGNSTGLPLITTGATGAPGFVLPLNEDGWLQTATANKDLHIKFAGTPQYVVVVGTYIEVA